MKPHLFIVGASHSNRLFQALTSSVDPKIQQIKEKFKLVSVTRPGSTFRDLIPFLPDPKSIQCQDILVCQLFGNNLFKPHIRTQRLPHGQKVIHLEKAIPKDQEGEWTLASEYLSKVPCKVLLINNPLRHLICQSHCHQLGPVVAIHQRKCNKRLKEFFSHLQNVQVLDYMTLSGFSSFTKRHNRDIEKYSIDGVHLRPEVYERWCTALTRYLF